MIPYKSTTIKNIRIGTVAPDPLMLLHHLDSKLPNQNIALVDKLLELESVTEELLNHNYSLIPTNQEIMTDEIESRYIGTEKLSVNLNQFTLLANKKISVFQ